MKFERSVTFKAAYDRRDSDPKKNYGIHGVDIRFVLKGPLGATQFLLFTGWFLPHVQAYLEREHAGHGINDLTPADLGYHSPKPQHEDHQPMPECDILGGSCYYDGSSLNAEPVYQRLLSEGDEGVWSALEDYYVVTFGDKEAV